MLAGAASARISSEMKGFGCVDGKKARHCKTENRLALILWKRDLSFVA